MKEVVQHVMENPKLAATVGAATTATGASEWFGWIPGDIGKFAALLGAVLTTVLIVVHIRKEIRASVNRKNP